MSERVDLWESADRSLRVSRTGEHIDLELSIDGTTSSVRIDATHAVALGMVLLFSNLAHVEPFAAQLSATAAAQIAATLLAPQVRQALAEQAPATAPESLN